MLKFLGFLVVMAIVFGLGVYVGRQGPGNVLHKAKQFGVELIRRKLVAYVEERKQRVMLRVDVRRRKCCRTVIDRIRTDFDLRNSAFIIH